MPTSILTAMKQILLAIALLTASGAPLQANPQGEALFQALHTGCAREWPGQQWMIAHCMQVQNDAAKRLKPIVSGGGSPKIFNRCWAKYNDWLNGTPDYQMVLACYRVTNARAK